MILTSKTFDTLEAAQKAASKENNVIAVRCSTEGFYFWYEVPSSSNDSEARARKMMYENGTIKHHTKSDKKRGRIK